MLWQAHLADNLGFYGIPIALGIYVIGAVYFVKFTEAKHAGATKVRTPLSCLTFHEQLCMSS